MSIKIVLMCLMFAAQSCKPYVMAVVWERVLCMKRSPTTAVHMGFNFK